MVILNGKSPIGVTSTVTGEPSCIHPALHLCPRHIRIEPLQRPADMPLRRLDRSDRQ